MQNANFKDLTPKRHKDIIDEDGKVIRKVWFEFIDNNDGLNLAVKDLKDNFEMYIERYLKWQKK